MDTPDRAALPASSRAEDSPLFGFIDSMSPIEPLKSAYSTNSLQAYQSLSITSISSIFTSPHHNTQKESKLSKSSFADFNESEVCTDHSDKNKPPSSSNAVRLFACTSSITEETHTATSSVNEGIVDPAKGPNDLPQPGRFESGSPDHNTTPCHGVRSDLKQDKRRKSEAVQTNKNTLENRKCLFSSNIQLPDGCQPEEGNGEVLGCDWEDLVSATSGELLAFDDTSTVEDHGGVRLAVNNAESCGFLLSELNGGCDISDRTHPIGTSQVYYHEMVMEEDKTENAQFFSEGQKTMSGEEMQDNLNEDNACIPLGCKVETHQQRGTRKRCLVFEAAGYSNRTVQKESVGDLTVSKLKGKSVAQNHTNPGKTPSPRVLRGIGLHLNALALTSKDKIVCQDPLSTALVPSVKTEQDMHGNLLSAGENFVHSSGELLDLQMDNDDCLAGGFLGNDHISSQSSSPQKKRRKSDNGDDESCKRCSCKKSKCLKLYCECFAAGVYCSEPCSCLGCLNKPIHEEIVLSTRKQIEFRNPLAFAPKVIRLSDAGQETQEDPNNTPASARHKRGCNCKKSSCLKKYCECYQGGVGCSSNCRCESCKNTFGMRDGAVSVENEEMKQGGEQTESCGKEKENDEQKANVHNGDHQLVELGVPITPPLAISSSLLQQPNFSNAKPPRPSKPRTGSSSRPSKAAASVLSHKIPKVANSVFNEEVPDILTEPASPGIVKTSSPNGKRVSPPHNSLSISPSRRGGRKLILKSIPSFPSLLGDTSSGSAISNSNSAFTESSLALGPP
ncbi:protein tesmin/TSO1-like CXC 2 [Brachypodium distachyon]|uniref:CRC domain-containing protein n=2 Tax=Brachypodium distachyon TaxID=15368 RepID=I1H364_BRADI|nr:protein tesmin/TSO1-like CXC 2 [Brachypodium distachyon]KQK20630.1 hypothetical protein BRADI_1g55710v3 [Brachypodium distachyon]|eukprot:XP_003557490.1 protein tesmin/TSO1-like CXC 2 [Brachypodium distachyon]